MNMITAIQIIGTISIFVLFVLDFIIALDKRSSNRTLRTSIIYTALYIFFLFIIRVLSILHIGTLDELRIISGLTSPIPLLAVIAQLFLEKRLEKSSKSQL